ncbi:MAG: phosphate ABC transporter ATP-binding protein [Verrucomicrobiota bacterium]
MIEKKNNEQEGHVEEGACILATRQLSVFAGKDTLLQGIDLSINVGEVFGLIGPSGAGKSTLLRCLNRLIDLDQGLRVEGDVLLHGQSLRGRGVDVDELRVRVGMLFQQPVVFPLSILKNVLFGVRHQRKIARKDRLLVVEKALRDAALWEEVKDRLHSAAMKLSVGQQQRLCLARTLAVEPEIILMDEPTSALDPKSTQAIDDLIMKLKKKRTIVLVTHHLNQARRLCDRVAFVSAKSGEGGRIACMGETDKVMSRTDLAELSDFIGCEQGVTCCES